MEKKLFWDGLVKETEAGPRLIGHKCTQCGHVTFPKEEICHFCLNETFESIELPDKGKLYSYTTTRVPVAKFQPPHTLGMVTLEDVQLRILAPLVSAEGCHVGSEMELVLAPYWEENGKTIWGYKFKTVEEDA